MVRRADGSIVWDPSGRTPGRGAYVCSEEKCLHEAMKGNRLARALRTKVEPGELNHLRREIGG